RKGVLLRAAGFREVRREAGRRARHSGERRLHAVDNGLRGGLHRRAGLRRVRHLLAERLQVTRLAAGAAAIVSLSAAVALHAAQGSRYPLPAVDRPDLLYVRSRGAMKRLAFGYDGFVADVYWIRALQHFGGERTAPPDHVRNYA